MHLRNLIKNRIIAGFFIAAIITVFVGTLLFAQIFHGLHLRFADSLYTRNEPSKEMIIVAIDDFSTLAPPEGLGRYSTWSRENYIKLLEILEEEDPKVIGFDIIFSKPTNEKIDQSLADKFQKSNNIILSFISNPTLPIYPIEEFKNSTTIAFADAQTDKDGILRREKTEAHISGDNKFYDSLALAVAKKYLNKEKIDIPLENEKMLVNYFANSFGQQTIPFIDVLNKKFPKGLFKNKIVLVGLVTFREIDDRVITPKDSSTLMPGVEVWANQIQTIIEGKFLSNQSQIAQIITIAIIAAAATIALNYLGIIFSILITLAAIIGYVFAAHFFYRKGIILNMVYPFITIVLTYLASWVYKYFIADKSKREITSAFSHYVAKDLVEQISKNPDIVKLGGEKKIVTVFFSDIKDSTTIAEKIAPENWVTQINEYFTVMENILKDSGGTLDKYEGDAIMGFWNAPISQDDHVARAYSAALQMQKALNELNQKWQTQNRSILEFRIGINTGEAIVGNFGSADRFDYTVMGDTVNTASRLESSANKTYGTKIIVAIAPAGGEIAGDLGSTVANTTIAISSNSQILSQFILRELDTVLLPGKKEPVKLFELICLAQELTPEINNLLKVYSEGLAAYRAGNFSEAVEKFESLKDDKPSQIMLARCQTLNAGQKISEVNENMIFRIVNK